MHGWILRLLDPLDRWVFAYLGAIGGVLWGKNGSAPDAPDPMKMANAQTIINNRQANLQTQLNRPTQANPFGTLSWQNTGTLNDPHWTSTVSLSPDVQRNFNQGMQAYQGLYGIGQSLMPQIQSNFQQPFSMGSVDAATQKAQDAIMSRMQPMMDIARQQTETRLANQGITQTSDPVAWGREMDALGRQENDARQQAVLGGLSYEPSLFNQQMTMRNLPLSEWGSLTGAASSAIPFNQMPQFAGVPQTGVGGVDYGGYANQQYLGQIAKYNQGVAGQNALTGGLMGLGGQLGGAYMLGGNAFLDSSAVGPATGMIYGAGAGAGGGLAAAGTTAVAAPTVSDLSALGALAVFA